MVNVTKNRALVRAQTAQLKLRGIAEGPSEAGLYSFKTEDAVNGSFVTGKTEK